MFEEMTGKKIKSLKAKEGLLTLKLKFSSTFNKYLRYFLPKFTERHLRMLVKWEVVVAQLVERSISIPEVRGSTPVIGKILFNICLSSTVLKR